MISIKQKAEQMPPYMANSTNNQYEAWMAVDGDTNTDFIRGNSCSKAESRSSVPAFWRLRFSGEKTADRYELYFNNNCKYRFIELCHNPPSSAS